MGKGLEAVLLNRSKDTGSKQDCGSELWENLGRIVRKSRVETCCKKNIGKCCEKMLERVGLRETFWTGGVAKYLRDGHA